MEVLCCISDSFIYPFLFLGWHISTEINYMEKKKRTTKKPIVKAHCHPSKLVGIVMVEMAYPVSYDPEHLYQQGGSILLLMKLVLDISFVHLVAPLAAYSQ